MFVVELSMILRNKHGDGGGGDADVDDVDAMNSAESL